jgi:hypothetical protein
MLKYFICKIKSHTFINAGSCPFTGKSYSACTRCGMAIAK